MNERNLLKGTLWTTLAFYALIAFEFFYMASPFAAYFYSVYRLGLQFINGHPSIAWITGFFLPHLAEDTQSPLINSLRYIGWVLAIAGLLTFLFCAGQVYYAKLFKKGVVTGGLYRFIRHPQYTAFAVCSFGLLLLWPRYLVLIMFVTMLFVYFLLARLEEQECETKYGHAYLEYKARTSRFIPVKLPFKHIPLKAFRFPYNVLIIITLYILSVSGFVQLANLVKKASVATLYTMDSGNDIYLSIYKKSGNEMSRIVSAIHSTNKISGMIRKKLPAGEGTLNYILPAASYISEIPMVKPDTASCHILRREIPGDLVKVIVTSVNYRRDMRINSPAEIIVKALSLNPLIEVWINPETSQIVKIIEVTQKALQYGNIAEPVF